MKFCLLNPCILISQWKYHGVDWTHRGIPRIPRKLEPERLEQFFIANDIIDEKKSSTLLAIIGPAAYRVIGNLVAPSKPAEVSYARIIAVMIEFYNPKPLVTVQRFKFYSRFRQSEESISTFVAELRHIAKDCDFDTALETNLRDRLVCGIADQVIQKRLLSEHKLTFEKAFRIAQSHESATKNVVTLQGPHQLRTNDTVGSPCYRCGRKGHKQDQCRFKTATCHHCGKVGHIQPVCRSRSASSDSTHRPSSDSYRSSDSVRSTDSTRTPRRSSDSPRYRSSDSFRSTDSTPRRSSDSSRYRSPSTSIKQISEDHEPREEEYSLFTLPSGSHALLYEMVIVNEVPISMEIASFTVISKKT